MERIVPVNSHGVSIASFDVVEYCFMKRVRMIVTSELGTVDELDT